MPEMIRDGRGTGYLLQIDKNNRAKVSADTSEEITYYSHHHGDAYQLSTNNTTFATIPSAGVWTPIFDLENLSSSKGLIVNQILISWNGGDTTGNEVLWVRTRSYATIVGNYTSVSPSNMNGTSNLIADGNFYIWDGTGNGISVTGGYYNSVFCLDKGRDIYNVGNSSILIQDINIGLDVMAYEIGKFTMTLLFYYKPLDELK